MLRKTINNNKKRKLVFSITVEHAAYKNIEVYNFYFFSEDAMWLIHKGSIKKQFVL